MRNKSHMNGQVTVFFSTFLTPNCCAMYSRRTDNRIEKKGKTNFFKYFQNNCAGSDAVPIVYSDLKKKTGSSLYCLESEAKES